MALASCKARSVGGSAMRRRDKGEKQLSLPRVTSSARRDSSLDGSAPKQTREASLASPFLAEGVGEVCKSRVGRLEPKKTLRVPATFGRCLEGELNNKGTLVGEPMEPQTGNPKNIVGIKGNLQACPRNKGNVRTLVGMFYNVPGVL